jgi:Ca-activated chloride channel family protein
MKTLLISILSVCFVFGSSIAEHTKPEPITISGKVVDPNNNPLIGASVTLDGTTIGAMTDIDGSFKLIVSQLPVTIHISYLGFESKQFTITENKEQHVFALTDENIILCEEVVVSGSKKKQRKLFRKKERQEQSNSGIKQFDSMTMPSSISYADYEFEMENTEQYGEIIENTFKSPLKEALSTFSLDVDRAAYSNVRRILNNGSRPPVDAVRIEEMINYFKYDYEAPNDEEPLAIHSTLTDCPWNDDHQLLHIGLQAKKIEEDQLPPSNLVFLIDVSGSMNSHNKLPLVKSSFNLLLEKMRPEDRVAIVTYAGNAAVLLESTSGDQKSKIKKAINSLGAGGSTGGAEGIKTAYEIAKQHFIENGNNRVILASDGDFNVGVSSAKDLEKIIEKERKSDVYLTVLGYGMGNYKDEQMQTLANKGNGNHAYIDNIQEAHKILISEFAGSMHAIAKDVKFQLEFNPAYVEAYRLVGYENRMLEKEDFNNDKKDAGEIGYGHQMTAIYEIIPAGTDGSYTGKVDDLIYQQNTVATPKLNMNNELATIKFRYKNPGESKSLLQKATIAASVQKENDINDDTRWAIAVAEFGMLLRDSEYIDDGNFEDVVKMANGAIGEDEDGYRAEFVRLVKVSRDLFAEELAAE